MPTAPTPATPDAQSNKRAFWIPDDLYERVKIYVDAHRNAPDMLTINQFVRDALEERLNKVTKVRGQRA